MKETELKILLSPDQEKRLRASPALREMSTGPARTRRLLSIYYDTEDHALRANGYSLRLRRVGRQWIQTLKCVTTPIQNGLSTPEEVEYPVRGQRLDLSRIPDDNLREDVIGLAKPGLGPVARTEFNRTERRIEPSHGVAASFVIDQGEVSAGSRAAPLVEAEIELESGSPADLYAIAGKVIRLGPVRYSATSKSERALALLRETPDDAPMLRKARRVDLATVGSVEVAASRILAEARDHAQSNFVRIVDTDDPSGPHQARVALRRFRTGLSAFRKVLGPAGVSLNDAARQIGGVVGALRDLDVLIDETLATFATAYPQEHGFATLAKTLHDRRERTRADVRAYMAGPHATAFVFHAAEVSARLAEETGRKKTLPGHAAKVMDKRLRAVAEYGERIETLTIDERHEMRKALKKLRYSADMLGMVYGDEALGYVRVIKPLQKVLGALNDAAAAEMMLTGPDAPDTMDTHAQRAVGLILGQLDARAEMLWPRAMAGWRTLADTRPFWCRA